LDPQYASYDSFGNRINDPFPTPFYSGGFDLAGVGILNAGSLGIFDNAVAIAAIYPNPAVDSFSIRMSSATEVHIKMYDSTGREVLSTDITSEDLINVSHLNAGIYILAIDNGTSITNKRLIIKK
ncbi:MAG: T9SS type A sorting domain-containing protein, partial [Flavobacterium sp.]